MRIIVVFIAVVLISGCAVQEEHVYVKDGVSYGVTDGLFRGRWWNYYERGRSFAEGEFYEEARQDYQNAIAQRRKDQWMSRTYGMHFVDYFPHRELGVVYFETGRHEEAVTELETSLAMADSAKAKYFLNKARRALLEKRGDDTAAPAIRVIEPADGFVTNRFSILVRGEAEDDKFVSSIFINGIPQLIELSAKKLSFRQELPLKNGRNDILVRTVDLSGKESETRLQILSDRKGPIIIVEKTERLGNKIRVTGSLADNSGIDTFAINGTDVSLEGKPPDTDTTPEGSIREWEFIHELEDASTVTLTASDIAGNITVGTLSNDPEISGAQKSRLYASLGNGVALLDTLKKMVDDRPPAISLSGLEKSRTVYEDTFYIMGTAKDNSSVKSITLNGDPISEKKGEQVFFSHLAKLEEGKNDFVVEAKDAFDNTATTEAVIERKIPTYKEIGSRMSIVILPLEFKGERSLLADSVYENLISAFVTQGRFRMIEKEKLTAILEELKLAGTELVDQNSAVKIGKLLTADAIITGSVYGMENSLEILTRLVNTETRTIMDTEDVYDENPSPSMVKELSERLAFKYKQSLPITEGIVIKLEGDSVYVDIGEKMKLKEDIDLIIFRKGEQLLHPVTGKALGSKPVELGNATVKAVFEDFSKARMETRADVQVMDSVITK